MTKKKRRMFDIEMPEDSAPEHFPAGKVEEPQDALTPAQRRRGPMATAIGETAVSARERREMEERIRQENDALAHEHVRLKRLGLVMDLLPLSSIDTSKLVRDRAKGEDMELDELKESIRAIGLSNPIRVEDAGDGRFELIQGYRRLCAYKALLEETGDERFAEIPAAVSQPGDDLETLYRRMVDENMVRKDISFSEMAQLALDYAADPSTKLNDPDKAVPELFRSAGYQKRSYIRTFIRVIERLGSTLEHAREVPRALGLTLAQRMEEDDQVVPGIRAELAALPERTAQEELAVLRSWAGQGGQTPEAAKAQGRTRKTAAGKARTSFQLDRQEGLAKCSAADGRLEIKLSRDFSTIDRRKLEDAVRRMLDELG
ncbi:ParB/RepB/Spo0J family partition protein [Citreimonas salinaria]|uniref:Chromosome partitioning protein, ParB family n=1 Tax=Citreimonas salinaria TaxID=321339 RepID=A0A1H3N7U5_9RHOB|nr:ParB N-terminal domain-containing protein [Citreimonas salinaria]SDY84545.1 chromosome partitioning protein, ParB family [Citreimonas salinaria]